ncbi:MAG: right-handed parallel beta-helix repeat-containing protein, partial [Thermoguttaceae bacterium]|nr:right-handed parallel beta-helix repeat-containing protein [Thermoguttaceae bacterium]
MRKNIMTVLQGLLNFKKNSVHPGKRGEKLLRLESLENRELLSASTLQDAQAIQQIVEPEIELVSTLEKPEYESVDLSKFLAATNPYPYVFSSAYLDETPHDAFNSAYAVDSVSGLSDYSFTLAGDDLEVSNAVIEGNTVIVQNADDSGEGSLRAAIEYARDHSEITKITFKDDLAKATITLASPLTVSGGTSQNPIVIEGNGVKLVAGSSVANLVKVASGGYVQLRNMELSGATGAAATVSGANTALVNVLIHSCGTGVEVTTGVAYLANVTIAGNTTGLRVARGTSAYLYNAIVATNSTDIIRNSGSLNAQYSIFGAYNFYSGTGNIRYYDGDPLFANARNGDYRPRHNSISINKGNWRSVSSFFTAYDSPLDLAGNDRVYNNIDIGAYEASVFMPEQPSIIVTTPDDIVDPLDGLISLREAVEVYFGEESDFATEESAAAQIASRTYAEGTDGKTVTFASSLSGQTITLTQKETVQVASYWYYGNYSYSVVVPITVKASMTIDGDTAGVRPTIWRAGGNSNYYPSPLTVKNTAQAPEQPNLPPKLARRSDITVADTGIESLTIKGLKFHSDWSESERYWGEGDEELSPEEKEKYSPTIIDASNAKSLTVQNSVIGYDTQSDEYSYYSQYRGRVYLGIIGNKIEIGASSRIVDTWVGVLGKDVTLRGESKIYDAYISAIRTPFGDATYDPESKSFIVTNGGVVKLTGSAQIYNIGQNEYSPWNHAVSGFTVTVEGGAQIHDVWGIAIDAQTDGSTITIKGNTTKIYDTHGAYAIHAENVVMGEGSSSGPQIYDNFAYKRDENRNIEYVYDNEAGKYVPVPDTNSAAIRAWEQVTINGGLIYRNGVGVSSKGVVDLRNTKIYDNAGIGVFVETQQDTRKKNFGPGVALIRNSQITNNGSDGVCADIIDALYTLDISGNGGAGLNAIPVYVKVDPNNNNSYVLVDKNGNVSENAADNYNVVLSAEPGEGFVQLKGDYQRKTTDGKPDGARITDKESGYAFVSGSNAKIHHNKIGVSGDTVAVENQARIYENEDYGVVSTKKARLYKSVEVFKNGVGIKGVDVDIIDSARVHDNKGNGVEASGLFYMTGYTSNVSYNGGDGIVAKDALLTGVTQVFGNAGAGVITSGQATIDDGTRIWFNGENGVRAKDLFLTKNYDDSQQKGNNSPHVYQNGYVEAEQGEAGAIKIVLPRTNADGRFVTTTVNGRTVYSTDKTWVKEVWIKPATGEGAPWDGVYATGETYVYGATIRENAGYGVHFVAEDADAALYSSDTFIQRNETGGVLIEGANNKSTLTQNLITDNKGNGVTAKTLEGATDSAVTVYSSTIANNEEYGLVADNSDVMIKNTIIALNNANQSVETKKGIDLLGTNGGTLTGFYSLGNSKDWTLDSGVYRYTAEQGANLFVGNNDSNKNPYELKYNSFAINAGSKPNLDEPEFSSEFTSEIVTAAPSDKTGHGKNGTTIEKDLNGVNRIEKRTDLGVFEYAGAEDPSIVVTTLEDVVDNSDNEISLREALENYLPIAWADAKYDAYKNDEEFVAPTVTFADGLKGEIKLLASKGPIDILYDGNVDAKGAIVINAKEIQNAFVVTNAPTGPGPKVELRNLTTKGAQNAALSVQNGEATIVQVLFHDNKKGAEVKEGDNKLTVIQATIADNTEAGLEAGQDTTLVVRNSIVAFNRTDVKGNIEEITYSMTDASKLETQTVEGETVFTNGNLTYAANERIFMDRAKDDYRLYAEFVDYDPDPAIARNFKVSRAISVGDSEIATTYKLTQDLGGARRIDNLTKEHTGAVSSEEYDLQAKFANAFKHRIDMGAYEANIEAPSNTVSITTDVVDPFDGLYSLREAVAYASRKLGNATGTTVFYNMSLVETKGTDGTITYADRAILPVKEGTIEIRGKRIGTDATMLVSYNEDSKAWDNFVYSPQTGKWEQVVAYDETERAWKNETGNVVGRLDFDNSPVTVVAEQYEDVFRNMSMADGLDFSDPSLLAPSQGDVVLNERVKGLRVDLQGRDVKAYDLQSGVVVLSDGASIVSTNGVGIGVSVNGVGADNKPMFEDSSSAAWLEGVKLEGLAIGVDVYADSYGYIGDVAHPEKEDRDATKGSTFFDVTRGVVVHDKGATTVYDSKFYDSTIGLDVFLTGKAHVGSSEFIRNKEQGAYVWGTARIFDSVFTGATIGDTEKTTYGILVGERDDSVTGGEVDVYRTKISHSDFGIAHYSDEQLEVIDTLIYQNAVGVDLEAGAGSSFHNVTIADNGVGVDLDNAGADFHNSIILFNVTDFANINPNHKIDGAYILTRSASSAAWSDSSVSVMYQDAFENKSGAVNKPSDDPYFRPNTDPRVTYQVFTNSANESYYGTQDGRPANQGAEAWRAYELYYTKDAATPGSNDRNDKLSPAINMGSTASGNDGEPIHMASESFFFTIDGEKKRVTVDINRSPANPRVQGRTVDLGAIESDYHRVEAPPETPSIVVTTLDDVINRYDNKISLREAIEIYSKIDGVKLPSDEKMTVHFDAKLIQDALAGDGTNLSALFQIVGFDKHAITLTGYKGKVVGEPTPALTHGFYIDHDLVVDAQNLFVFSKKNLDPTGKFHIVSPKMEDDVELYLPDYGTNVTTEPAQQGGEYQILEYASIKGAKGANQAVTIQTRLNPSAEPGSSAFLVAGKTDPIDATIKGLAIRAPEENVKYLLNESCFSDELAISTKSAISGIIAGNANLTILDSYFTSLNSGVLEPGWPVALTIENSLFEQGGEGSFGVYANRSKRTISEAPANALTNDSWVVNNSVFTYNGAAANGWQAGKNAGYGMFAYNDYGTFEKVHITNSIFTGMTHGFALGGDGVAVDEHILRPLGVYEDVRLMNVVTADNKTGLVFQFGASGAEVINTTIANNKTGIAGAYKSVNLKNTILVGSETTINHFFPSGGIINAPASTGSYVLTDDLASLEREGWRLDHIDVYDKTTDLLFKDGANADLTKRDYSLVEGSVAINSGNNAYVYDEAGKDYLYVATDITRTTERIDKLGNLRFGEELRRVDRGAYEFVGPEKPSIIVTTLDDVVDKYDGWISLREAIEVYFAYRYHENVENVIDVKSRRYDADVDPTGLTVTFDLTDYFKEHPEAKDGDEYVFNLGVLKEGYETFTVKNGMTIDATKITLGENEYAYVDKSYAPAGAAESEIVVKKIVVDGTYSVNNATANRAAAFTVSEAYNSTKYYVDPDAQDKVLATDPFDAFTVKGLTIRNAKSGVRAKYDAGDQSKSSKVAEINLESATMSGLATSSSAPADAYGAYAPQATVTADNSSISRYEYGLLGKYAVVADSNVFENSKTGIHVTGQDVTINETTTPAVTISGSTISGNGLNGVEATSGSVSVTSSTVKGNLAVGVKANGWVKVVGTETERSSISENGLGGILAKGDVTLDYVDVRQSGWDYNSPLWNPRIDGILIGTILLKGEDGYGIKSDGNVTISNSNVSRNYNSGVKAKGWVDALSSKFDDNAGEIEIDSDDNPETENDLRAIGYGIESESWVKVVGTESTRASFYGNALSGVKAKGNVTLDYVRAGANGDYLGHYSRERTYGVWSDGGNVTVSNSDIYQNGVSINDPNVHGGGGILATSVNGKGGAVFVENSIINQNLGDGVRAEGDVSVVSSRIYDNDGYGINANGDVTVLGTHNSFSGIELNDLGGIYASTGDVTLIYTVVAQNKKPSENPTDKQGWGVYADEGKVTLANARIDNNASGGVYGHGGVLASDTITIPKAFYDAHKNVFGGSQEIAGDSNNVKVTVEEIAVGGQRYTNVIESNTGVGILAGGSSEIDDIYAYNNSANGLEIEADGVATVREGLYLRNSKNGILVNATAKATISNLTTQENTYDGVQVKGDATITNVYAYKNQRNGVYVDVSEETTGRPAKAFVQYSRLNENNANGALVQNGGDLTIQDSYVQNNTEIGINVDEKSKALAIQTLITGNKTGVYVLGEQEGEPVNPPVQPARGVFEGVNITIADSGEYGVQSVGGDVTLKNTIVAFNPSNDLENENGVLKGDSVLYVEGKTSGTITGIDNGISYASTSTEDQLFRYDPVDPSAPDGPRYNAYMLNQLVENNPAINAGNNAYVDQYEWRRAGSTPVDLTGVVRRIAGPADNLRIDLGVFEFDGSPEQPSIIVTTLDDVVNPYDHLISLREAIEKYFALPNYNYNAEGAVYDPDGRDITVKQLDNRLYNQQDATGRTITFASHLNGKTITLKDGETLTIKSGMAIDAAMYKEGESLHAGVTIDGTYTANNETKYGDVAFTISNEFAPDTRVDNNPLDSVTFRNLSIVNVAGGVKANYPDAAPYKLTKVALEHTTISELQGASSAYGVDAANSTVTTANSVVADFRNGGFGVNAKVAEITNSTITGSTKNGVYAANGVQATESATINNSTISKAAYGVYTTGADVTISGKTTPAVRISGSTIRQNALNGVEATAGSVSVANSTISLNSGRGVNANGNVVLEDATIRENNGDGVYSETGAVSTTDANTWTSILGNYGYGVFAKTGAVTLVNVEASKNYKSGAVSDSASVSVTNSTMNDNGFLWTYENGEWKKGDSNSGEGEGNGV